MTQDRIASLDEHYRSFEDNWTLEDRASTYAKLVVPNGNAHAPFHRWFHFKEGYSSSLLATLLEDTGSAAGLEKGVVDPFSGSGTTLVSAVELAREGGMPLRARGIERNPAIQLIAAAKVLGVTRGAELAGRVESCLDSFWTEFGRLIDVEDGSLTTRSVTLNNSEYFDPIDARELVALGRAGESVMDPQAQTLLRACAAITVESVGRLRRDGRALRYSPGKAVRKPVDAFKTAVRVSLEDMMSVSPSEDVAAEIALGDARDPHFGEAEYGVAVFSPPYPNNIDYTEVYKTEAWALGLYRDETEMREQRLRTLRSHPSVTFPETYKFEQTPVVTEVNDLLAPVLAAVPEDRYAKGRKQIIAGYADDMLQVLTRLRATMSTGSLCAVIVGNSSHSHGDGQFLIAADVLIARLAELSSWTVDAIWVARRPRRRTDQHGRLRESVILLRATQE